VREPQETTIDGFGYRVRPLGAYTGNKVLMRLGKAVLPALSDAESLDTIEGATSALSVLLSQLSEGDMLYIVNELAEQTHFWSEEEGRDGGKSLKNAFDSHFSGRYQEQGEWLWFALKVNFGFLAELQKKKGPIRSSDSTTAAAESP
jgi:hypothetical protein